MKKSSVIAVALIYLVAIIIVGLFGVRLKVYNPVVYVDKIVWDYKEYDNKKQDGYTYKVKLTTEEEKKQGVDYDAHLKCWTYSSIDNLLINIKCHVEPFNATNTKLNYYLNVSEKVDVSINVKDDNTADIVFNEGTATYLSVKSTDGRDLIYTIYIEVISYDFM